MFRIDQTVNQPKYSNFARIYSIIMKRPKLTSIVSVVLKIKSKSVEDRQLQIFLDFVKSTFTSKHVRRHPISIGKNMVLLCLYGFTK